MPWHRSGVSRPVNALTKKSYRGVNVVALWAAAEAPFQLRLLGHVQAVG